MSNYPTKWNLSILYKSLDDPQILKDRKKYTKAYQNFAKKYKDNKKYLKSATELKIALDDYNDLLTNQTPYDEALFISLSFYLDQDNDKLKAKDSLTDTFIMNLLSEVTFFPLEIAKIPKEKQTKFLKNKNLSEYKHFLEKIFQSAKYQLSDKEEQLLLKLSKGSTLNWSQMVSAFVSTEEREVIINGKKKKLTTSDLYSFLTSKDAKIRKATGIASTDINKTYARTATYEMNTLLEYTRKVNELRGAENPETMQHLKDDIPTKAVNSMINVVKNNYKLSHRYYEVKAKTLGLKKLYYYDRAATVGNVKNTYTYTQSIDLIRTIFNELDPEFGNILDLLVNNGQIDVNPKKGKYNGGFCTILSPNTPTFILINHTNTLNDLLTIAHELGHAINNELMKRQKGLNYDITLSITESPSLFFETLVLNNIISNAPESEKRSLLHYSLFSDLQSIFRQTAAYSFELDLHKEAGSKGFLSEKEINKLFVYHMKSYLGPKFILDENTEPMWVNWPHFRTPFYVYSYVSGQLLAKSLLNMIKKDSKDVSKLKYMLSAGMSESPINIFKNIGMDLTKKDIWENGLNDFKTKLELLEEIEG